MGDQFSPLLSERLAEIAALISSEDNNPALSLEVLLDAFVAVYTDCRGATNQNEQVLGFLKKYRTIANKLETTRINTNDFENIKTLATGAVGRVCLVRSKKSRQVYAMKILKKHDLLTRQEAAFFMEERNVLVLSQKSEWFTTLYASFQDDENLYLVMEYVSGASFRALMNNRESIMEEDEARFYIAEMILALGELHAHQYIHRDVKPENYLLDAKGHIKLADFGSCIRMNGKKITSQITVGTPDYISPEILRANEGNAEYGQEVDWWSLGIILYELLCDETPFYSESLVGTYGKIMNHEKNFAFPEDVNLSDDGKDLIGGFICKAENRLAGLEAIKKHPWFKNTDWNNIRNTTAPFIPVLSGPEDTRYFEDEDNEAKKFVKKELPKSKEFSGNSLAFVGYSYVRNATAAIHYPGIGPAHASAAIPSYEKETKAFKELLQKEKDSTIALESLVSSMKLERTKMEAEIEQIRIKSNRADEENSSLQSKVSQLQQLSASTIANTNMIQELNEIKHRLESDIASISADFRQQQEETMNINIAMKDSLKSKVILETKIKELQEEMFSAEKDKSNLKAELEKKSLDNSKKIQEMAENVLKLSNMAQDLENLQSEVKSKEECIQEKMKTIDSQNSQLESLQKTIAIFQLELESSNLAKNAALEETNRLAKDLNDVRNSAPSADSNESHREALNQAKSRLTEDLSAMSKQKATIEIDLASSIKLRGNLQKEVDELKEKVVLLETKIVEIASQGQKIELEKTSLEHQVSVLKNNLGNSKSLISSLESTVKDLEELLNDREALFNDLSLSQQQSQAKLELQEDIVKKLEEKVKKIGDDHLSEMKLRISAESEVARFQNQLQEARAYKHAAAKSNLDDEVMSLQTNFKILQMSLANMTDQKNLAIEKVSNLSSELEIAASERGILEDQLTFLNSEAIVNKREISRCQAKIDDLNDIVNDLEKQNETLKEKAAPSGAVPHPVFGNLPKEASLSRRPTFLDRQPSKNTIPTQQPLLNESKMFSRSRMSSMLFKSKENLISDSKPDLATKPSNENLSHTKSISKALTREDTTTSKSSVSSGYKAYAPMSVLDFFNPMDGLSGWLKVPKGGKVKKGWKSLYVAFSEDKLMSFENQDDFLYNEQKGQLLCEISCEVFVARSVSQNELIHANANEIDLIFKIQAYTPKHTNLTDEEREEKEKRIGSIKISIGLEERMLHATEKILAATSQSQKVSVIGQIDEINKRLRTFKGELEKLLDPKRPYHTKPDKITELQDLMNDLTAQMEDEIKKKEFMSALAASEKKKSKHSEQAKNIEVELLVCDRLIAKFRENLEILHSPNEQKKEELLAKNRENQASSNTQGHVFSLRQYFKPTDCGICSEPLWNTKNVGIECSSCKFICHKECGNHIDITCANQIMLKNIPPMYFMATNMQDRSRWLAGLQYYRKNAVSQSTASLKTFVEPVQRMSMMPTRRTPT